MEPENAYSTEEISLRVLSILHIWKEVSHMRELDHLLRVSTFKSLMVGYNALTDSYMSNQGEQKPYLIIVGYIDIFDSILSQ